MKLASVLNNSGYEQAAKTRIHNAFKILTKDATSEETLQIELAGAIAAVLKLDEGAITACLDAQTVLIGHHASTENKLAAQAVALRQIGDKLPASPARPQSTEHMQEWLQSEGQQSIDMLIALITVLAELKQAPSPELASRTLSLYLPIANRLGFGDLKSRLANIAFKIAKPKKYQEIEAALSAMEIREAGLIKRLKSEIIRIMREGGVKQFEIKGRHKSPYSIYLKMPRSGGLDDIKDYIGMRLIVPTTADCYKALEIFHSHWAPVSGRLKDYIAKPKPNGYKSIHTVVTIDNKPVEIHIRTRSMHEAAEYGMAAHWRYDQLKTGESYKKGQLVAKVKQKTKRQIFVFTPKYDLLSLPKGSCALDFAFAVHTNLGLQAFLVKINGKVGKLNSPLNNGDVVEIITQKRARPHEDWLRFVKTAKARNRIRARLAGA